MTDGDVAWYRQLLDARPELVDQLPTWTVVQPLTKPVTVPDVVGRLGADPAGIQDVTGWDSGDWSIHLVQAGPAVLVLEVAGGEGVRDEVLRRLSDGAVVHSSWWGAGNGRSYLCYAAFGRVLTRLEHVDDLCPTGERPTALDEDRAPLRGDLDYPVQLALMERRTGIRLDAAWLDAPHPMVELRKPIPDGPQAPSMFAEVDPDLAAMLVRTDEATHRAALHWVLSLLADEYDLHGEPSVGAVLDALSHEWPAGEALWRAAHAVRMPLLREVEANPGEVPEHSPRYRRMRAADAFAATVIGPYGQPAPPDTLWYAQQALPERWYEIRAELCRRARRLST